MTDRCEKCHRVRHPEWNGCEDTYCFIEGGEVCRAVSEAFRAGLRAGVELAKEHADPDTIYIGSGDYVGAVDWTDVDHELAKRTEGR